MSEDVRLQHLTQKVRKLPQHEEQWEISVHRMRMLYRDISGQLVRPYLIIIVNDAGLILFSEIVNCAPETGDLFHSLLKAMKRPMPSAQRPGRPTKVMFDQRTQCEQLAALLAGISVACEYLEQLTYTQEPLAALNSQQQFNDRNLPQGQPGLAAFPDIPLELRARFYHLAAEFYRLAPWRWLSDNQLISIRYPASSSPRFLSIMGNAQQAYGLVAFDTKEQFFQLADIDDYAEDGDKIQSSLSLMFDRESDMRFDDCDDIETHQWPIAGELAFPLLMRVEKRKILPPDPVNVRWLVGAMAAFVEFLQTRANSDGSPQLPVKLTLKVDTIDGVVDIELRGPMISY